MSPCEFPMSSGRAFTEASIAFDRGSDTVETMNETTTNGEVHASEMLELVRAAATAAAIGLDRDDNQQRSACLTELANSLVEVVAEIEDRPVTAAEANMADILRRCATQLHTYSSWSPKMAHRQIRALRHAVVDLNHGYDPDSEIAGGELMGAALALIALLTSTVPDPGITVEMKQLLCSAADSIDAARRRDLRNQPTSNEPIVVDRIGGPVRLQILPI